MVAAGIRYATDLKRAGYSPMVINMSLGGPGEALTLRDALTYAVGKGVFVAISAGNAFEDGNEADFPAKYAETIDGVMAVGAVGRGLKLPSEQGARCECCAV